MASGLQKESPLRNKTQFGPLGRTYPVPFFGAKRDWLLEKYFQSHIVGESSPEC